MLTSKQETFCQAIVDGKNQSDAYKVAYEADNMLPATVSNEGYILVNNPDVAMRIQELRATVVAGRAWAFAQGMDEVETNIAGARRGNQWSAARAATRDALELSRLLGVEREPPAQAQITKVVIHLASTDSVDAKVIEA
jgi:hypothetical protein